MKSLWRISILMMLVITLSPAANAAPGDVKWTFTGGTNLADLALATDGTVYVTSQSADVEIIPLPSGGSMVIVNPKEHYLFALNPDGTSKWEKPVPGPYLTVLSDGKIVTSLSVNYTYLVNSPSGPITTGDMIYRNQSIGLEPNGESWLETIPAGRVAVTADNSLIAFNYHPEGGLEITNAVTRIGSSSWTSPAIKPLLNQPVIGPDGTIYGISSKPPPIPIPSGGTSYSILATNQLYALTAQGEFKTEPLAESSIHSLPAIGQDGSLFFASTKITPVGLGGITGHQVENNFVSMSADLKTERWKIPLSQCGVPAIGAGNQVYVGSSFKLYALDDNGGQRWSFSSSFEVKLCPALASDGTVYIVSGTVLYALNSTDGSLLWSYNAGNGIKAPPTIGADATIFLLLNDKLIALEGTAPPANAPWPQDRHDAQRTSRATQASTSAPTKTGDGKFSLTLNLEPGRTYKVETSEDLQTWTEIGSFTSTSAALTFLDESSAGKPQRFYRLVMP